MGGTKTSHGGQILESVINALKLKNFSVCPNKEYCKQRNDGLLPAPPRLLVKNCNYTTIFGTPGRREWYIISTEWTGELECKFQAGPGSTDEKMLYVSETFRRNDEPHMAVVYGGPWWNSGRGAAIIAWLKKEAEAIKRDRGKQLLVLDVNGFMNWAHRTWK